MLEKEKEIYRSQAAAQGKPAQVQDKIAEGKLKQFYSDFVPARAALRQGHPSSPWASSSQEKIATLKENIVVRRFARFKVGEESKPREPQPPERSAPVARHG